MSAMKPARTPRPAGQPGRRLSPAGGPRPLPRRTLHGASQRFEPTESQASFPLTLRMRGDVPAAARDRALTVVLHAAGHERRPVLAARLALAVRSTPARDRPAEVHASLELNGRTVRAHAGARNLLDAIDLLEARLRRKLVDADDALVRARRPRRLARATIPRRSS